MKMKELLILAVVLSALLSVWHVSPASAEVPPPEATTEFQGCTPGFWKNHPEVWPMSTNLVLGNLTGLSSESAPSDLVSLADDTLLEALKYRGGRGVEGAARILLRAAVAAGLNAAHPDVDYPLGQGDVVNAVYSALDNLNRKEMLELASELDGYNNAGCPAGVDSPSPWSETPPPEE